MASAKATTDHDEIRRWVEARGGYPAHVTRTGDDGDPGVLRIDYPGFSGEGSLERISWDDFFEWFDRDNLAFLYQDEKGSRFSKLVDRSSVKTSRGRSTKRAASSKRGATKRAASSGKRASSSKRAASSKATAAKRSSSKRSASSKRSSSTKPAASTKRAASTRRTASTKRSAAPTKRAASKKRSASPKRAASAKRATSAKRSSTGKRPTSTKRAASQKVSTKRGNGGAKRRASARTSRSARRTTDHDEIRRWVEARGGYPARVKRSGRGNDPGILRVDYPGYSGTKTLERIDWDEFFDWFDRDGLAFLYQDTPRSRFSKLVSR